MNPMRRILLKPLRIKYKDGQKLAKLKCGESGIQSQVCLSAESYIIYIFIQEVIVLLFFFFNFKLTGNSLIITKNHTMTLLIFLLL